MASCLSKARLEEPPPLLVVRSALNDPLLDRDSAEFIRQRDHGGEISRSLLIRFRPLRRGRGAVESDLGGCAGADCDLPGIRPRAALHHAVGGVLDDVALSGSCG